MTTLDDLANLPVRTEPEAPPKCAAGYPVCNKYPRVRITASQLIELLRTRPPEDEVFISCYETLNVGDHYLDINGARAGVAPVEFEAQ
jgi:hypothetical protein